MLYLLRAGIAIRIAFFSIATDRSGTGSAGRATAGVLRIGNSVGAAMSDRRVLEPVEARIMTTAFPRLLAYPLIAIIVWLSSPTL
jgi:cardiolipin synthase A/B